MRNDPPLPDEPDQPTPAGGGSSADDALAGLSTFAGSYHQLMRTGLTAYLAAADAGTTRTTGLGPGLLLELEHRLPAPVARQLETVAARLPVMPDCAQLYARGGIEFDELACIVRAARRLTGAALAELDRWAACAAAELAEQGLLHLLDGDVQHRVEQLRAPGWASRQEARTERGNELHCQFDFDGGGLLFASLEKIAMTTAMTAIETVAGPPTPDRPRAGQRADALVAITEHALAGTGTDPAGTPPIDLATTADDARRSTAAPVAAAGHAPADTATDTTETTDTTAAARGAGTLVATQGAPAAADVESAATRQSDLATTADDDAVRPVRGQTRIPTRPRPRITLVVDLAQATTDRFALLQRVSGLRDAPTLSARTIETLAAEAELLLQLTDGRRPLAELRAQDIPAAVRRAVITRDRGCRAPGCAAPPSQCDLHHIVARGDGGSHDPDNLVALCRRNHTDIEQWQVTLDPTTAVVTWRRHGRRTTHRTVPHGTRPPPARPPDVPLADWEAPPIPPPPAEPPAD